MNESSSVGVAPPTRALTWRHRRDVEGLRGIAILAVILYHSGVAGASGGFLGVDVFFVLSGFLITGVILEEVDRTNKLSLRGFWARRARRLLPASLTMTLIALVIISQLASPFALVEHARAAAYSALYSSNLLFSQDARNYFDGDTRPSLMLHTWSLSVEEQFYFVFAPLAAIIAAIARHKRGGKFRSDFATFVVVASVASFAASIYLRRRAPVLDFYMLPTRMWELGIGAIIALQRGWIREHISKQSTLIAVFGGIFLLASLGVTNEWSTHPGWITAVPVISTAALLVAGESPDTPNRVTTLLSIPSMTTVGRLSYSWYLWHWPLLVALGDLVNRPTVMQRLGVCALALGIANVSYRFVEQPIRRSQWLALRPTLTLAGAALLSVTSAYVARRIQHDAKRISESPALAWARNAKLKPRAVNEGCLTAVYRTDVGECVYGHPDGKTTVVMFGDSHMLQWFPAIEQASLTRGWRLVVVGKAACPSVSVGVMYIREQRAYPKCSQWRENAFRRIARERPAVIITSNFRSYPVIVDGRPRWTDADAIAQREWGRGLEITLRRLTDSSTARIIVLKDSPYPRVDVIDCLTRKRASAERCAMPVSEVVDTGVEREERRATATSARAEYVDLTSLVCGPNVCDAARGDTAIYRDSNHLTVAYTSRFAEKFGAIIGGASSPAP